MILKDGWTTQPANMANTTLLQLMLAPKMIAGKLPDGCAAIADNILQHKKSKMQIQPTIAGCMVL
jgi:hypothetical protein